MIVGSLRGIVMMLPFYERRSERQTNTVGCPRNRRSTASQSSTSLDCRERASGTASRRRRSRLLGSGAPNGSPEIAQSESTNRTPLRGDPKEASVSAVRAAVIATEPL